MRVIKPKKASNKERAKEEYSADAFDSGYETYDGSEQSSFERKQNSLERKRNSLECNKSSHERNKSRIDLNRFEETDLSAFLVKASELKAPSESIKRSSQPNKARFSHPAQGLDSDFRSAEKQNDSIASDTKAVSEARKKGSSTKPVTQEEVYLRAVYLLSMREHSELELQRKLESKFKGFSQIEAVLQRLIKESYLDNARFAEVFFRQSVAKGHGPTKIRMGMSSKGISADEIEIAFEQGNADWSALARELYIKKYANSEVTDYKEWSKRARFLHSRGFSSEVINSVIPSV